MKINLTPREPYDFQVDNMSYEEPYRYDLMSEVRIPEQHYVEFDGVVRTVKDFRNYVRAAAKMARERSESHAQEIALLKDQVRRAETALEDYRNHGRWVVMGAPDPVPRAGMTVFGVDYDEAYKRVMDFPDVQRKIQITNSNNVMLEQRDEARRREIAQLQEALRQKNEIIKDIREKVAEARIYE